MKVTKSIHLVFRVNFSLECTKMKQAHSLRFALDFVPPFLSDQTGQNRSENSKKISPHSYLSAISYRYWIL